MSFAFQPFYSGDYYRDTRHLSMLQHGAYRQLLDHCWDQRGPLPLELDKCFRICGAVSKEEQDAVRSVVSEYFVRMEDGHYNRRMQKEIERAALISDVRSDAAHTRWKARDAIKRMDAAAHDANAMQMHSTSNASATPPPPPPPPQSQNTDTARKRAPAAPVVSVSDLVAAGVQEAHARDWLRTRGKPLTQTAWTAVQREAGKAKLSVAEAVRLAAEAQWRGFKAEWIKPELVVRPNGAACETSEYLAALRAHKAERPPVEVLEKIRGIGKL